MDWNPHIIGHRGASRLAPENTLAGFAVADEMGLPGAELDVHLTRDGRVVVIHDHTVDRATNGSGRVEEMSFDELRALDAAAAWAPRFRGTTIPTLDDVLERYGRRFAWEIEFKVDDDTDVDAVIAATLRVIDGRDCRGAVQLTSFRREAVAALRDAAPGIRRRLIVGKRPPEDVRAAIDAAVELGCAGIGIHQSVLEPDTVAYARERGLSLTGWQGNTPEELERLAAARVDGFSSDQPDAALAWLRAHGVQPRLVRS